MEILFTSSIASSKTSAKAGCSWLVWPVCLIYGALVIFWSSFHELWRDEVMPVTCVVESRSFFDLFTHLKNSGHPSVWFVVLYWVYQVFPHYSILKIVNLFINILAAYLFLKKAPFLWIQRILFLLGYFTFYYFPVFNRSYGLCWLFFLIFCIFFEQRWKKILPLSGVLFLLANTHAEGLIITIAIGFMLTVELFTWGREQALKQSSARAIILGLGIIIVGVIASIWQVRPDSNADIISLNSLTLAQARDALWQAVSSPGIIFRHVLGGSHRTTVSLVIAGCYFLLLVYRQWTGFGIMVLSTIGLSMFLQVFFPYYDVYHESFVYMLMIFAFWVTAGKQKSGSLGFYLRNLFLIAILLSQILMAYPAIKFDVSSEYSSSKRFAQWINTQPLGKDFTLIGEPDYLITSIPYYISNDIYVPREHKFSRTTKDRNDNQRIFSLDEFLSTAEDLRAQGRNVLLVMGHHLNQDGPFEIKFSYNKIFRYSPESLALWEQRTKKVASFQDSLEEEYDVFILQ